MPSFFDNGSLTSPIHTRLSSFAFAEAPAAMLWIRLDVDLTWRLVRVASAARSCPRLTTAHGIDPVAISICCAGIVAPAAMLLVVPDINAYSIAKRDVRFVDARTHTPTVVAASLWRLALPALGAAV